MKNWGPVTRSSYFHKKSQENSFSPLNCLRTSVKKTKWPMSSYFWTAVCLINLLVHLDANPVLSWWLLLCGKFWDQELPDYGALFFLPALLWPFWVFWISIDMPASNHQFLRKQVSCSDFGSLKSINQSRKYCLNYIKSPSPWTWYISQLCMSSWISVLWTCCQVFICRTFIPK